MSVLGVACFVLGRRGSGILVVGLGALLVFVGVFVLGPLIARTAARVLGAPVARMTGVTGAIARQNAMRNPKRTARTGGALMVGVALVVAITVIAATARDWTHDVISGQFTGDFVVSTNTAGFGGISPEVATRRRRASRSGHGYRDPHWRSSRHQRWRRHGLRRRRSRHGRSRVRSRDDRGDHRGAPPPMGS